MNIILDFMLIKIFEQSLIVKDRTYDRVIWLFTIILLLFSNSSTANGLTIIYERA